MEIGTEHVSLSRNTELTSSSPFYFLSLFASCICCCSAEQSVSVTGSAHHRQPCINHNAVHFTSSSGFLFFCAYTHTLDRMTHLEGTLKCTLGLREEENDPVGEFLCITGRYVNGMRATQPPLTKMRDQWDYFLPGSNGRNVECMFRADGFRCSMSGNYSKATLWTVAVDPFIMHCPEVIYS